MKKFHIAIVVSIAIHATFVILLVWWSLHPGEGFGGGGGGIVEVAFVGGEGDSTGHLGLVERQSVRDTKRTVRAARTPTSSDALSSFQRVPSLPAEENGGGEQRSEYSGQGVDGEGGGAGMGVGSGSGRGDPRLMEIWAKINRSKYYPELARRQRLEGTPKINFIVTSDGKIEGVKIVQSSGSDLLDQSALETIKRSSPLPYYPKPITIAVRYSLKDR
jgi:TonB family protein